MGAQAGGQSSRAEVLASLGRANLQPHEVDGLSSEEAQKIIDRIQAGEATGAGGSGGGDGNSDLSLQHALFSADQPGPQQIPSSIISDPLVGLDTSAFVQLQGQQ